jgi:hypothetical protein
MYVFESKLREAVWFRQPPAPSVRSLSAELALDPPTTSMVGLLKRSGPFEPDRNGFDFTNSFPLTETEGEQLLQRYRGAADVVGTALVGIIRVGLGAIGIPLFGGLPNPLIDYVVQKIAEPARDAVLKAAVDAYPAQVGRCGGMAFAALDLYEVRRSARALGGHPASGSPLDVYIFQRLLDSLDANLGDFMSAMARLHVLPVLSVAASGLIGSAVGTVVFGPVGAAIGGFFAGKEDVLNLGGRKSLMQDNRNALDALSTRLLRNPAWPIGLVYGSQPVPWENHQVLATRLVDHHNGFFTLWIYDNNLDKTKKSPRIDLLEIDMRGDAMSIFRTTPLDAGAQPHSDADKYLDIAGIVTEDYVWRDPSSVLK